MLPSSFSIFNYVSKLHSIAKNYINVWYVVFFQLVVDEQTCANVVAPLSPSVNERLDESVRLHRQEMTKVPVTLCWIANANSKQVAVQYDPENANERKVPARYTTIGHHV